MNWPTGAMCYKNGQFYDSKNRVVRSNDTLGTVANDNAIGDALANRIVSQLVGTRIRRNAAMDAEAEATVAELLPALRAAVAVDDAESEQQQYGEPDEAEANDEEEMPIEVRIANGYIAAKKLWEKATRRNRQRSQFAGSTGRYASATATDDSTATAKPSKYDLVAANAKAARQTSMFKRF